MFFKNSLTLHQEFGKLWRIDDYWSINFVILGDELLLMNDLGLHDLGAVPAVELTRLPHQLPADHRQHLRGGAHWYFPESWRCLQIF